MIKSSNKVVLKNEEGEILEISAESFDIEKYINSTILGYKYILEIDGNEINFSDSKKRTEFLKTINNCFNKKAQKSFNTFDFPIIELAFDADYIADFHECLAAIKRNGKWGFIDKTGKLVIPCVYDAVDEFHDGLARVNKDGKLGFIDKTGKEVIPFEYDYVCDFHEGLAGVRKNGKYGFIDKTGKEVIPFEYDYVCDFHEGLAGARKNGKYGFIDKTGKEVIPFEYNSVSAFHDGFVLGINDEESYYIDKNNQKLNLKLMITDIKDVFTIPNNSTIIDTKTGYALDFQDDNRVLFNSNEEREEFIKLLDETINIDPSYKSKKLTKKQKTNA